MRFVFIVPLLFFLAPISLDSEAYLEAEEVVSPSSGESTVAQFGVEFDEVVIADSNDYLDDPRDLEFHPSSTRSDELWIVNRATDSVTIIHETGTSSQWSEVRLDAYRNHFMEEVSAIAFGSYHAEFDWQFGTAQDSRNTYNNQASPNNFMGPTLWPSSLSHLAVEHQDDGLLGSHTDMQHESPFGVGIAHDSDNAYWYFDGYHGELVYYDFQQDHDTGMDDHSDGIVRRYSDVQLFRVSGIPGHMELDSNGILYIANTGTGKILWVNTDDSSTTSTDIYDHESRLEPLEEYSRINGVEWGVLASGLSRPSGIALDGDTLFVSTNGNDQIRAYELSSDGRSANLLDTVNTSAQSIMGLEIGPDNALYYVDGAADEVIRIDPKPDQDSDGIIDEKDNCLTVQNPDQLNHDNDLEGDACDLDDDNDSVADLNDSCQYGEKEWVVTPTSDHDNDGCRDATEDDDDDNDSIVDYLDDCSLCSTNWTSDSTTDHDGDGCADANEDLDDDSDSIADLRDECPYSRIGFISYTSTDFDGDGCEDSSEDLDDDGDGFDDNVDDCAFENGTSSMGGMLGCIDSDSDGRADEIDAFVNESTQWSDLDEDGFGDNPLGNSADDCIAEYGTSTKDRLGCPDNDGDGWSNEGDKFPNDIYKWADSDDDGFADEEDDCPNEYGTSTLSSKGCPDTDSDGWSDEFDEFPEEPTQYRDSDGDGYGDNIDGVSGDSCPDTAGESNKSKLGCPDDDGDGWSNEEDIWPNDARVWSDSDSDGFSNQQGTEVSDDCPDEAGESFEDRKGCPDEDGDGVSDSADYYPNDPTRSKEESLFVQWWFYALLIPGLVLPLLFIIKRGGKDITSDEVKSFSPPIPPEGIPPGWTIEQWNYYGEDWLRNQGRL